MAIGLRPNVTNHVSKFALFSIKFLVTFKKIIRSQGGYKRSVKIVFVAKMT